MTAENFDNSLICFLNRRPFKLFTIELVNGRRLEVDMPNAVVVSGRDSTSVPVGSWLISITREWHESSMNPPTQTFRMPEPCATYCLFF